MAKTDTETRLKTLLSELNTLQGKISGIVAETEKLKEERNRELSGEFLIKLREFSEALKDGPMKVYGEIQKRLTALQDNDPQYFNKISDKANPYNLKFKDVDEERFITTLLGNCLKPGKSFEKFLVYIAGRAGKGGNMFFRKEGE